MDHYLLRLYAHNETLIKNLTFPNTTSMVKLSDLMDGVWYRVTLVAVNGTSTSNEASFSFRTDVGEWKLTAGERVVDHWRNVG